MRKAFPRFFLFSAFGLLVFALSSCSPAAKKDRSLVDANKYYDAGEFDKAEVEYLNVLKKERLNPQAISRLGLIYFDQGRLGRVMPYLSKAKELQPDNIEVRLKLGALFLATGKLKEARDEATYILTRQPTSGEAIYLLVGTVSQPSDVEEVRQRLAQLPHPAAGSAPLAVASGFLDLRQNKPKEAKANFERALSLDPKSVAANAALGALALQDKDLAHAEQYLATAAENSPARSLRRIQYALFKIQNGDPAGGRRLLAEMTKKVPDYIPAQMALARIALEEKKFPESSALVAKVLELDPAHLEALLLSAQLKLAQNETGKSVAESEKIAAGFPQSPQAQYQLAVARLASGETNEASASLNKAQALDPSNAEMLMLRARINMREGDFSAAILNLKQLLPQHPDMIQAWLMLADAYSRQGNFPDTLAVYDQIEKYFPGSRQTPYLRGLVFVQQRKWVEARQAFNRALEISPDHPLADEQLANLDLLEGKYPAARQRVAAMMVKDPKSSAPWLLQAKICYAQKDIDGTEAALKKAIELQPELSEAYYQLAGLYAETKQQQKTLANLEKIAAVNPKDTRAVFLIGTLQEQQKNYAAARASYEKLLELNPRSSEALNNLAFLYSEQFNEPAKALALAQRARDLLPRDAHVADTLGWILHKQRQYPRALNLLMESAEVLPNSATVQFHLGMTHYMLGHEKTARSALEHALELNPNLASKDEARSRLAILATEADSPGARTTLETALAKQSDDPVALVHLAAIQERKGDPTKAIKTYQAALQSSPTNVSATLGLAQLYFAQKDTPKALEVARAARKLAPNDPEIVLMLGRLAYQIGEHQWAASLLQEAIQRNTDSPDLYFDLAQALYGIGRVADAEAALRSALNLGGLFLRADDARRMLSMIALTTNPAEAAKQAEQVEQSLKSTPDYLPAIIAFGTIKEQLLDTNGARQAYERALRLFPDFSPAKLHLAILGAKQIGFDQKTFDWALDARSVYPADPELAKALGILTYRKGDHARAEALLKESLAKREDDAELWFYLGMAQSQLNESAKSKASLQRALDLNLKADLAIEARKKLSEKK